MLFMKKKDLNEDLPLTSTEFGLVFCTWSSLFVVFGRTGATFGDPFFEPPERCSRRVVAVVSPRFLFCCSFSALTFAA